MTLFSMKIASEQIRTIVVEAYSSGAASRKQLAEIFGYHIGSISRWIRENRKTERLAPLPRGHRVSVFNAEERKQLAEFIENNPDATLDEIRNHFQKPCSLVAIHKIVRKLGYVF
ncbi:MAG: helix-turn-helix domain-containing protein [Desulfobulbaceae bacterium]|nr:helix-turn-helix domain-containing protein [Desulfobulbaceae bacterium]